MRGKKRPLDERMRALSVAVVGGAAAASQSTGIPESTIRLWMDKPEYAELRAKTDEDLATGFLALAHLALGGLMDAIRSHQVEPRDLAVALGIATDKRLLMSGQATSRYEAKDLTKEFDDHELDLLREAIEREDSARTAEEAAVVGDRPEGSTPAAG